VSFKQVLLLVHPQIGASDLERELAKKLINKLDKVEIAYRLARILEDDLLRETPEIRLTRMTRRLDIFLRQ